ncbi:cwf21 domain-containing protein [Microdochium nivale]|nr:cwf21 domain-containing protein [Microdochium nivale]
MSYDNVGLSTPRGSGTSGFVQRSLAHMKPRDRSAPYPPRDSLDSFHHRQRQPDKAILEHDRKREVEVKVFELRDKLEDDGIDEDEIDRQCDALRKELIDKMNRPQPNNNHNQNRRGPLPLPLGGPDAARSRNLKMHQVHELADAKIKQDARFRNALRISKDYKEGGHWKKQEERLRKAEQDDSGGRLGEEARDDKRPEPAGRAMRNDANDDHAIAAAAPASRGRGAAESGNRREGHSRSPSRSLSRSRSRSRTRSRSQSRSRSPPPGADRRRRSYSDRSGLEDGEAREDRYNDRRSRSPERSGRR